MSAKSPLIALVGPTAAGKTEAAIALCEQLGGEIISCDSLAVYRGCDIGTAKPSAAERARVPHHLLDVASPDQSFTAARYVELADSALSDLASRHIPAILTGGTGLYLRALLDGIFPSPPPDPELRARLKSEAAEQGWPTLHARLATVDPEAAARIHPNDSVRIERALEVYEQTGETLSSLHARHRRAPRYPSLVIVFDPPKELLNRRIAERTDAMLAAGLVEETARLVARFGRDLKPLGALGYKESLAFLDGRLPHSMLAETIRIATQHFARRQRTWFRKQPGPRIARASELPLSAIEEFLRGAQNG